MSVCGVPWEADSRTGATKAVVVRAVKRTVKEGGVKAVDRVRWWRRRSMQSCGRSGWQGTESSKRCKKLVGLLKLRLR